MIIASLHLVRKFALPYNYATQISENQPANDLPRWSLIARSELKVKSKEFPVSTPSGNFTKELANSFWCQ